MAKQFGYTASILKDTNRLIASSQADWSSLRDDSYIIFDKDDNFYKVIGKEKFFYIKDFVVSAPNEITIDDNTDIKISLNDQVVLTFKEYEVTSVGIEDPGVGFTEGDTVEIKEGVYKTNSYDGIPCLAKISIDKVGDQGQVLEASIITPGVYYNAEKWTQHLKGSLRLKPSYGLIEKRTMEERSISKIKYHNGQTILTLNNNLPENVMGGKISVDKWELILNINYLGETKVNEDYRVLVDFTPNLNIPLMRGDLKKNVSVFNEAVTKIDGEIKRIWDHLGK